MTILKHRLSLFECSFKYGYAEGMPRPRTFDEQDVIDRAMELFWTRGYEATSVSDLTAELGLHPGSLYRTFGDKRALFLKALAHYRDSKARTLAPTLRARGPVLPRIRAVFLGWIELAAEQDSPRGCLIANTAGELLPGDQEVTSSVSDTLSVVEDGFLQGLRAAARTGEVSEALDLPSCAVMLTMLLEGLQVLVKADPDPRRLVAAVDTALASITAVGDPAARRRR
jgi:TetR/AcrR family transcriptional regulator, transcriptional repressor for nem operon